MSNTSFTQYDLIAALVYGLQEARQHDNPRAASLLAATLKQEIRMVTWGMEGLDEVRPALTSTNGSYDRDLVARILGRETTAE